MSGIQFCSSFALENLQAIHDFSADTFKIALFSSAAALSVSTTSYSTSNEVANGNGYTTGGATAAVSSSYPSLISNAAGVRFDTVSWTFTDTQSLRYGLLYNSSKSNRAVAVLDIGQARNVSGLFEITFPLSLDPFISIRTPVLS